MGDPPQVRPATEGVDAAPPPLDLPPRPSFEDFYRRELRGLVALAHALTGSPAQAEEVAQEAMLVAFRRWDHVSALDLPVAWVRRTCANLATSVLRRRGREARALLRWNDDHSDVTELGPTDDAFWSEVRRLPRRQAQCIALYYVYGCTVADVATTLDCSTGTVKQHLARARTALAGRLTRPDTETPR